MDLGLLKGQPVLRGRYGLSGHEGLMLLPPRFRKVGAHEDLSVTACGIFFRFVLFCSVVSQN